MKIKWRIIILLTFEDFNRCISIGNSSRMSRRLAPLQSQVFFSLDCKFQKRRNFKFYLIEQFDFKWTSKLSLPISLTTSLLSLLSLSLFLEYIFSVWLLLFFSFSFCNFRMIILEIMHHDSCNQVSQLALTVTKLSFRLPNLSISHSKNSNQLSTLTRQRPISSRAFHLCMSWAHLWLELDSSLDLKLGIDRHLTKKANLQRSVLFLLFSFQYFQISSCFFVADPLEWSTRRCLCFDSISLSLSRSKEKNKLFILRNWWKLISSSLALLYFTFLFFRWNG